MTNEKGFDMAKRVKDAFDDVRVAAFSADIQSINGDTVELHITSVSPFKGKHAPSNLKGTFVTVSRMGAFMKQYPQGGVGSHVEGVVTLERSPSKMVSYRFEHIVRPV